MSLRDSLCKLFRRQSAIFAWSRATFKRALARFFEPFCFLFNRRCSRANRFAYLTVWRGLPCLNPVSVMKRSLKPKSMPTVEVVIGSDTGSNSQRLDTKYRPAASLDTVTVDGTDGKVRDQRTSLSLPDWARSYAQIDKRTLVMVSDLSKVSTFSGRDGMTQTQAA